jgi:hypothetical protein
MKLKKIRFMGKEMLMSDGKTGIGGAITTKDAYEKGHISFAHLCPDGNIMRYGKIIGTKKDIEIIGEEEVHADYPEALINLLGEFLDQFIGEG